MGKLIKKIIIIGILIIGTIFSLILIQNKIKGNVVKENNEQAYSSDWLFENCECLEKQRYRCIDGYEMKGTICYNSIKRSYSSRLIGCSKYECLDKIVIWNNSSELWEAQ
jgi:hypothetical protein